jgi:hypothetical protein
MARCSPLGPLGEVATTNVAETENIAEVENVTEVTPSGGGNKVPIASGDEGHALSGGETDGSTDGGASDNKNTQTYSFGASIITLGHIKEMAEKGYFVDGKARAPGAKTVWS